MKMLHPFIWNDKNESKQKLLNLITWIISQFQNKIDIIIYNSFITYLRRSFMKNSQHAVPCPFVTWRNVYKLNYVNDFRVLILFVLLLFGSIFNKWIRNPLHFITLLAILFVTYAPKQVYRSTNYCIRTIYTLF